MTGVQTCALPIYFEHQFVDHVTQYAEGMVHTNGLENFWSLFKRCIKGTHVAIEPFHLAAYVDSEAFRFNNRESQDIFNMIVANLLIGTALRYKALTAKTLESRVLLSSSEPE